jgi:tRNA pseudouridine32 synthase/23S rRNA pseudouridine746 synthase
VSATVVEVNARPDEPDDREESPGRRTKVLPGLDVVHEHERFVVIDKPAGLLSVRGKGPDKTDCAAERVRAAFPRCRGPVVVHRLDMDTSGLMVLALDGDAQRELCEQFAERRVRKAYVALVDGLLGRDRGEINLPMRVDLDRRPVQIADWTFGRAATTRFEVTALETDRTRVRLEPITGRTHQLRLHCAHPLGLDAPILGDVLYGPPRIDPAAAGRLMLHATELAFNEPGTGRELEFVSTAPF